MNIESVELKNFMRHEDASMRFPAAGTVLVTGPNGSGKSTFIEAVSWCLWGKTLRGAKPWRPEGTCEVTVHGEGIWATRRRVPSGKVTLRWGYVGRDEVDFDTTVKAQAALQQVVGVFDVWRKTHVLSAADAGDFAKATDATRKRLLEELLGIDRIDSARELCVADLSGAEQSLASAEAHLQALEAGHTTVLRSLQALEAPSPGSKPPSESQMRSTRDALSAAISESKQIRKASAVKERELGAQNAELAQLQRHMRQLLDEKCPTCQQTVPVELRESLQTRLQALVDQIADAKDALADENALSASMLEELEDEVVALRMKLYKMEDMAREAVRALNAAQKYRRERGRLQDVLADNRKEHAAYTRQKANAESSVDVLKTVRTVLGVRGFRAHLLDEATGAIETIANTWLDAMNAPMRIRLGVDSRLNVALEVDGVAGDQGYLGASSGERRRVDVALLLALADLAGSSTSREPGTLFLDEVFDTLDPSGVSGVCEVLDILGESRAAVVITHSDDLQGMVDATKHVAL